jgi:hypothetical protein
VALFKSRVQAVVAEKVHFKLPATVKTYEDASALAADLDVDLVTCVTHVNVHLSSAQPALRVGKAAFVEWPLAKNLQRVLSRGRATGGQHCRNARASVAAGGQARGIPRLGPHWSRCQQQHPCVLVPPAARRAAKGARVLRGQKRSQQSSYDREHSHDRLCAALLGDFKTVQSRLQIQRSNLDVWDWDNDGGRIFSTVNIRCAQLDRDPRESSRGGKQCR